MEADVALHASEAWATSADPRAEKIKYVYSNRRKERDSRAGRKSSSSRIQQMKPSRSYDNEIESSIHADSDLSSHHVPSSSTHKARDDSSLKYTGEKLRSSPTAEPTHHAAAGGPSPRLGGHPRSHASSQLRTKQSPELCVHRDHHTQGQGRWRPRNKNTSRGKPPAGDKTRTEHHHRRTLEKQSSLPEASAPALTEVVSPMTASGHKLKPSTSVDDQLQMTGKPKIAALDLQADVAGRAHTGSSPGIVLEVKHGPTVHYRPSDTMLSDNSSLECLRNTAVRDLNIYNPDERPLPALRGQKHDSAIPEGVKLIRSPDEGRLPITADQSVICPPDSDVAEVAAASMPQVNPKISKRVNHDDIVVGPAASRHKTLFGVVQEASDETAFSSPSIMFQQKAGIRHDDMVVGPVSRIDPFRASPYPVDSESDVISTPASSDLPQNANCSANLQGASISSASSDAAVLSNIAVGRDRDIAYDDGNSKDYYSMRNPTEVDQERETCIDANFHHHNKSCDSNNPAAKSFTKVKDVEKKSRGSSPGSGIPIRRGGGGGDRSRDRSRGMSPGVSVSERPTTDTAHSFSPSVSEDFNYGSSNSLPGGGEHVRWRPKDKKTGPHRMRREGKKEKNVSTESGYITDQAFYSEVADATTSGFSPDSGKDSSYLGDRAFHSMVPAHGSLDRQTKPSSHAKRIPSSPSSRSRSAHTTPVKKSMVVSSKGQPLSNIPIPIPISHDERNRKHPPNVRFPDPSQDWPSACVDASAPPLIVHERRKKSLDSFESASQESIPSTVATLEPMESKVATGHQPGTPAKSRGTTTALPSSSLASSSTASLPAATALSVAPPLSSSLSSSAAIAAAALVGASSSSSSAVKPRLHRSAEHLLANAKLVVYQGPDEGDQPDDSASDISVATACSMPARAVTSRTDRPTKDSGKVARAKASSGDLVDKSGLSSKRAPAKGRCVSLLRREKERSTAIVRRGSDRAVPVDLNDPSTVGLKAATSHKELCQSMASLLNIDNEKAAEMLSTSLSKRQDLVEGLDADAIMDYLTHHGVLDPSILVGMDGGGGGETTNTQRNSAILRHVEEHGDTAVALFINALRQSGQLHLASSLDTEQRIKPVSGNTYYGKSRHKGEICVRLQVEALKILAPREPTERNVNLSLLSSPSHGNDGPTVITDDEDDQVKPKSCWCFCISRKRKSSRSSSKKDRRKNKYKDGTRGEMRDSSLPPPNTRLRPGGLDRADPNLTPHRTKSVDRENNLATFGASGSNVSSSTSSSLPSTPHRSTPAKSAIEKKKNTKKSKHKSSSGKPHVPATIQESDQGHHDMPEVAFHSGARHSAGKKSGAKSKSMPKELHLKPVGRNADSIENSDGIIMEYDAQLELVKLRAGHDELASPTRQSGPLGILVEQWKYSGKHFLGKAEVLCQNIVDEFHTDIIKYFEQDRGTLVLDVVSEGTAVVVFNICMTKAQVQRLETEAEDGHLLERLQERFTSKVDVSKFDIRGVQYRTVVDENQLKSVLSELS